MKTDTTSVSSTVQNFASLPDCALVGIPEFKALTQQGRSSFYRAVDSGQLTIVKLGRSCRVRVGELRRLMGITSEVAA